MGEYSWSMRAQEPPCEGSMHEGQAAFPFDSALWPLGLSAHSFSDPMLLTLTISGRLDRTVGAWTPHGPLGS